MSMPACVCLGMKAVLKESPQMYCNFNPVTDHVLHDSVGEITPMVTDIMNKSLSSDIVPQPFKHALVRFLLKKASLNA